ncbi:MAG: TldD/PmbA family protein [Actinobacteria bacterium]|nr:TldD/PmbA family protein [Actinomycetota bacterium]
MQPDFEKLDIALEGSLSGGATEAEAFLQRERELTLKVFNRGVEKYSSAETRGIGLRTYLGDRLGRAFTSDVSEEAIRGAVASAVQSARVSPGDSDRGLPGPEQFPENATEGLYLGEDLQLWGEDLDAVTAGEKIEFALEMERVALEYDPRIIGVETATYSESAGEVVIVNSRGFRAGYRSSVCYGYLVAIAEDRDGSQTGFGFTAGRSFGSLDAKAASKEASSMAVSLLGGRQVETAKVPVLFDNLSTAEMVAMLAAALSGEAVTRGRSFLAGRLGEKMATEAVTIVDDGLSKGGFGTAPFDDEGVATSSKSPVEEGVLRTWLHNCYTASRMGTRSTGNAGRPSFRARVAVTPTNIRLEPGRASPDELRSGIQRGFEVLELQGAHVGLNPVTGEVSVGAKGRWVQKGRATHAVTEVTIAGTMEEILGGITGIGNDIRFTPLLGGVGTPSILVEGLVVSGK